VPLTVCAGGTLEWPPGVETLTLVSKLPFSAMPGIAMMVPPMSRYTPTTRAVVTIDEPWNHITVHHGTHRPRPPTAQTNLGRTFPLLHRRDVGHPISNRAQLICPVVERFVSLTCKPLISSSKPKARTTVRADLNCFSSKVSMDALFWV